MTFHSDDPSNSVVLILVQSSLSLVLPSNAKNGAKGSHEEILQLCKMLAVQSSVLTAVEERSEDSLYTFSFVETLMLR